MDSVTAEEEFLSPTLDSDTSSLPHENVSFASVIVPQESDYQNMPAILVFPNLAKCFCWRETQARFEKNTLPSQVRLHHEEKILNEYIAQNGIEITC